MDLMFDGATSFIQDLSAWDVDTSDDTRNQAVDHFWFAEGWGGGTEPNWPQL